jgi:hypothetical protein
MFLLTRSTVGGTKDAPCLATRLHPKDHNERKKKKEKKKGALLRQSCAKIISMFSFLDTVK